MGAGQCNEHNEGTLVGEITIHREGSVVTVHYQMDGEYCVATHHIYYGIGRYPIKNGEPTVAPGQLGHTYNEETPTKSVVEQLDWIDDSLSETFIIVHGEVCTCQ